SSAAARIASARSSILWALGSPVDPPIEIPWEPLASCQRINRRRLAVSSAPSAVNGVITGPSEPVICLGSLRNFTCSPHFRRIFRWQETLAWSRHGVPAQHARFRRGRHPTAAAPAIGRVLPRTLRHVLVRTRNWIRGSRRAGPSLAAPDRAGEGSDTACRAFGGTRG